MNEDLDSETIYAQRFNTFTDEDEKNWMRLSKEGKQLKVIRMK